MNKHKQMDNIFFSRLKFYLNEFKKGKIKPFLKGLLKQIRHEKISLGFKLDLNKEQSIPKTLIKIDFRISQEGDEEFFNTYNPNNGLFNQLQTCYVATTKEGNLCFRCWLIDYSQNKKIKSFWKNTYPHLNEDEVLLENAITTPKFRGMGIHPNAMYQIAKKGKIFGAKFALSFVNLSNINSLKSFHYASFQPYNLRREKWLFFRKTVTFEEIPNEIIEYYNKVTMRKRPIKV